MSLATAKSELLVIAGTHPSPKIVKYLGIVVSVAQRNRMGNAEEPGTKKAKFAKYLSKTGMLEQIPGILLPNGANLIATGCQALIFSQGEDAVAKYPLNTIGATEEAIEAHLKYERYCLETMLDIFGENLLPDTQPGSGQIRIRPFGELESAEITQERICIAYDLFSDMGLWLASDAAPGSSLHNDLVRLLDGAKRLHDEHGVLLDTVGDNNIVITDTGGLKIIDYDPNQHAEELVHDWEHDFLRQKKFAIECLLRAVRH